jgi:hypothetical protein
MGGNIRKGEKYFANMEVGRIFQKRKTYTYTVYGWRENISEREKQIQIYEYREYIKKKETDTYMWRREDIWEERKRNRYMHRLGGHR